METPDEIRKYVGKAMYDAHGQIIFRGADKDNLQQFLDVRGWGAIQNMEFESEEEMMKFQDSVGQWVTDVINEKLEPKELSDEDLRNIRIETGLGMYTIKQLFKKFQSLNKS